MISNSPNTTSAGFGSMLSNHVTAGDLGLLPLILSLQTLD
jgi:hypothetical protein